MELDRYNQIHDCFVDVVGKVPSEEKISYISDNLPREIIRLAEEWGWYDTEVGDKTYRWIEENVDKISNV